MKQYYTYTQEQHDNIVGRVNEYLDNNQIPDFTAILDKYFPEDNNGVKPKLSSLQRFHQRKLEAQKNGDDELSRKRQRTDFFMTAVFYSIHYSLITTLSNYQTEEPRSAEALRSQDGYN